MRLATSIVRAVLCVSGMFVDAQTLPLSPFEDSSSAAFAPALLLSDPHPVPDRRVKISHRILTAAVWPGYGMLTNDSSAQARSQSAALAFERAGFVLDLVSTGRGLKAHHNFVERDPINTLFGESNVKGVLGSMIAWEIGYSYASVELPRLVKSTPVHGTVRYAALIFDGALGGQRIRVSACNFRLAREKWVSRAASCGP
jgi:hypothetical protein